MATVITNENFETEVLSSELPVLIDFYADWCGPCKMMAPVLEEISTEVDNIKICKINIDEEQELAEQFNVASIPTFVVMKNGEAVKTQVGAMPKDALLELINV